jgi:hypothetical protein
VTQEVNKTKATFQNRDPLANIATTPITTTTAETAITTFVFTTPTQNVHKTYARAKPTQANDS